MTSNNDLSKLLGRQASLTDHLNEVNTENAELLEDHARSVALEVLRAIRRGATVDSIAAELDIEEWV